MKGIVYNAELLKELTGSDRVKVLTEKKYSELLEELDKLEKKLAIAVKALEKYANENNWFGYDAFEIFEDGAPKYKDYNLAEEALKQMKVVK